jgi:hypothetical protein
MRKTRAAPVPQRETDATSHGDYTETTRYSVDPNHPCRAGRPGIYAVVDNEHDRSPVYRGKNQHCKWVCQLLLAGVMRHDPESGDLIVNGEQL